MQIKAKLQEFALDKQNLTISEFKFSPNNRHAIMSGRSKKQQPAMPALSRTLQNWRKKSVYRQDKEKRKQRGQNKVLFIQSIPTERQSNMFLTWHDRSSSTRHFQTITQRIVHDVAHMNSERGYSQKRLPSISPSIEMRKLKWHNTNRVVEQSPMELVTRKLEWEGRATKRIIPYSINKLQLKTVSAKQPQDQKKALQKLKLSGWQRQNIDHIEQMQF